MWKCCHIEDTVSFTPKSFLLPLPSCPSPVNYYCEFNFTSLCKAICEVDRRHMMLVWEAKRKWTGGDSEHLFFQDIWLWGENLREGVRHKLREEGLQIKKILAYFCAKWEEAMERQIWKLLERLEINDERGSKGDEGGWGGKLIGEILEAWG